MSLLYQLATMEHHPESVPINALVAVEGNPSTMRIQPYQPATYSARICICICIRICIRVIKRRPCERSCCSLHFYFYSLLIMFLMSLHCIARDTTRGRHCTGGRGQRPPAQSNPSNCTRNDPHDRHVSCGAARHDGAAVCRAHGLQSRRANTHVPSRGELHLLWRAAPHHR